MFSDDTLASKRTGAVVTRWLLPAISVLTVGLLIASPIAFANHGEHENGDDHDGASVAQVAQTDKDNEDEDENTKATVSSSRVAMLVKALNNQAAKLSAQMSADDDSEGMEVGSVRTLSLAALEKRFSTSDATAVTNAVNANTAAVQTFLTGGSAGAKAVNSALTTAGVSPTSVLAILMNEDRSGWSAADRRLDHRSILEVVAL